MYQPKYSYWMEKRAENLRACCMISTSKMTSLTLIALGELRSSRPLPFPDRRA